MDLKLRAQLIRDECLGGRPALNSYLDSRGWWTIGIGHLIGRVRRIITINLHESDAFYVSDVADTLELLERACPFTMGAVWLAREPARYRALINMAFNRGGNMLNSTSITPAINRAALTGNWAPVGPAIAPTPWAAQVGIRAVRLSDALVTGTD